MTSLSPALADSTHEQQFVTPLSVRGPFDIPDEPLDQARWDAWVLKGRRADAAFAKKMRMVAVLAVAVSIAVGTGWAFLG